MNIDFRDFKHKVIENVCKYGLPEKELCGDKCLTNYSYAEAELRYFIKQQKEHQKVMALAFKRALYRAVPNESNGVGGMAFLLWTIRSRNGVKVRPIFII